MEIVWKSLMKCDPPGLRGGEGEEERDSEERNGKWKERLTASNFAKLSGMEEMTENRLRTGQNRFLMYRSYSEVGGLSW